jgi:hypothetical protein
MLRTRNRLSDFVISAGALAALVLILASFDVRVREQFSLRVGAGQPSAQVASAGTAARELAGVVFDVARDQSIEHAPLVIFVLAATVLVLFMLRT